MEYSFKLPDLGEGIVESELVEWHVAVGDEVAEDDLIADVQTDKAVVEVTAPVSGRVIALGCAAGEVLNVGAELLRFELPADAQPPSGAVAPPPAPAVAASTATAPEPAAESAPAAEPKPRQAAVQGLPTDPEPVAAVSTPVARSSRVLASPSLRRKAREAGIDLADVPAARADGRVTLADFERFQAAGGVLAALPAASARASGTVEAIKLAGARRVIARRMQATKRDIPHYSYVDEVDVTELEALRVELNARAEPGAPKLTLLPFLIRALVRALPEFPHCNAQFDEATETLHQFVDVHAGIATMTPQGLMVPVVRSCASKGVWQLAAEIAAAAERARGGKAKAAELRGSTITVTSLGALGGIASTPVLNAPETAIIGVNKMQQRPVVVDGQVVVRTMMNLSASFDHRIVDGYDGASLVQAVRRLLQRPAAMFVF